MNDITANFALKRLQAPKILLIGEIGTGKTYSAAMLAKHGISIHFLMTEPGMNTLESSDFPTELRDKLGKGIHVSYVSPSNSSFDQLIEAAGKVRDLNFEMLSNLPAVKKNTSEWIEILKGMSNYKCDISGEVFGPVDSWGFDRCIVIDSLSGLNTAAKRQVVGHRPTASKGDWGVAMKLQEDLLDKITLGCRCWGVLTAHPERESDENTGGSRIYPGALGQKLGPKIGRNFSEVIETRRSGTKHVWSTMNDRMALKRRVLPMSEEIPVDWTPIYKAFQAQLIRAQEDEKTNLNLTQGNKQ